MNQAEKRNDQLASYKSAIVTGSTNEHQFELVSY